MRVVLFAVIAIGCGNHQIASTDRGSGAAAAGDAGIDALGLDQDLSKLAERSVLLFDELAKAFAAAGEDCAAATGKLAQLTKTYADVVAANAKVHLDGRGMKLQLALRPHGDKLDVSAKAIMGAKTLPACAQDPAFQRAFDELRGPQGN